MSRFITKGAALLAVAALAFLSMFGTPNAQAQTGYAPGPGFLNLFFIEPADFSSLPAIACGGQPYGVISGGVAPYTVTYTLTGTASLGLGSVAVPNQGNFVAPAGTIDYSSIPDGPYVVNYVVRDAIGSTYSGSYPAVITDNCDGGADPTPGGVPVAPPASVPAPSADQLAFTGNDVSLPITAGAILIGSGGLMLLAANKRSRTDI